MGTGQVTALIVSIFGSYLGTGALAAFYYANNLQSVALSLFAISFAIAVFPLLSDMYNQKDREGFKDVLAKTSIQILYFIVPISILMLVLRAQLVRLVLGIGQATNFTFADTKMVAQALGLFSISLFAQALIPLFTRAFYALQNTLIPVVISFITIGVNLIATSWLTNKFGIPGMALSFSITSIVNLIILLVELHRKLGNVHDDYLIINSLKIIIGSILAGAASFVSLYLIVPWVNTHTYWGIFVQGSGSALIGIAIYLLVTWSMGLSETHHLFRLLRTTGQKVGTTFNIIWNWRS
jgi:putative peptidoglycan lipid II flippase